MKNAPLQSMQSLPLQYIAYPAFITLNSITFLVINRPVSSALRNVLKNSIDGRLRNMFDVSSFMIAEIIIHWDQTVNSEEGPHRKVGQCKLWSLRRSCWNEFLNVSYNLNSYFLDLCWREILKRFIALDFGVSLQRTIDRCLISNCNRIPNLEISIALLQLSRGNQWKQ